MPGWDVDGVLRRHITVRQRLKTLAVCWDFQFSLWVSHIKSCRVFFSFTRAKPIFTKKCMENNRPHVARSLFIKEPWQHTILNRVLCKIQQHRWQSLTETYSRVISADISLRSIQLVLFITAAWSQNDNSSSVFFVFVFFLLIWFFLAQLVL